MLLGALVDAGVSADRLREALGQLPLSGFTMYEQQVLRAGIAATKVTIELDEAEKHPHRGLSDVLSIVQGASLPVEVTEAACAVFRRLAEAEARIHATDVDHVHFHEVGAVDAICDIVGAAVGLQELGVEELLFSTVRLGGGSVSTEHGMLPVPAPATAELLRGLPTAGGPVDRELTTPTGAAVISTLGRPAPFWPAMSVETIGHGAGSHELREVPNLLRLVVGHPEGQGSESDAVWVLETNLDDMTAEEVGHCTDVLLSGGALDVFITPVQMKKNRPGFLLTVLCAPERLQVAEELIWKHTSTLGVRRSLWQRSVLRREVKSVETPWGDVRVKVAYLGDSVVRREPEYEDCRAIALKEDIPLRHVYEAARRLEPPLGTD
jgi:uncharacterized protein (TIGR00299 family) protein